MHRKRFLNKAIGIVAVLLSCWWIGVHVMLIRGYSSKKDLVLYIYPDWALIIALLLGIVGIVLGVLIYLKAERLKKLSITIVVLFIFAEITKYISIIPL